MTNKKESQIAIDARWCVRPLGSTCERCVRACPHHSISFDENELPRINPQICANCCVCVGVCDVFVDTNILQKDILAHALACAERFDTVFLTCFESLPSDFFIPAKNVLVLNCLAELSPQLWTAMLARGVSLTLTCNETNCKNCAQSNNRGFALWHYALGQACNITGKDVAYGDEVPQFESIVTSTNSHTSTDRRELFTNVSSTVQELSSGERKNRTSTVLEDFLTLQERMHARSYETNSQNNEELILKSPHKTRIMPPRHEFALDAIKAMPQCAKHINLNLASLNDLRCDCIDMPCTTLCPSHALRKEFGKDRVSFDPKYCIGCGWCEGECPCEAIELKSTTAEVFME